MKMNKLSLILAFMTGLAACDIASGISFTPSSTFLLSGDDNSQSAINAKITAAYPGVTAIYTSIRDNNNPAGIDSGLYAASYDTAFFTPLPDSDAVISYVGPSAITSKPAYALIKDGNASPNWYLFDLSTWNGTDNIEFSSFFLKDPPTTAYNISHVAIYGTPSTSVPDGGMTAALLGFGLVGFSFLSRRKA